MSANPVSVSNAKRYDPLAVRALTHLRNGTTDQAPDIMTVPVSFYRDEERYHREIDAVFMHQPLGLLLSAEVPEPGCYVARTIIGKPLLIVRGNDRIVRVFLNVCRHRGAKICKDGAGKTPRFVCPYHAWSYDRQGDLVGMYGKEKFGPVDAGNLGLTSLPSDERAGIIWGVMTPGAPLDIDAWLGDFADELDTLKLAQWHVFEQREIPGPGWKVTMDGYLEAYHHDQVHATTLAQHTIGNLMLHDTWGPHQRLIMGRRNLPELNDRPQQEWNSIEYLRLIHSIFPNMSVSGILGDHCLVSQIMPGATMHETLTRQTILSATAPATEAEIAKTRAFSAMAQNAVQGEDYPVGFGIQAGLDSGANSVFRFGRNEPGIQHYHRMVAKYSSEHYAGKS